MTTERLRILNEQVTSDRGADPYAPATLSTSVDRQAFREADGADVVAAIGDYERQLREYGYAAVAASRQAEAETGARRHPLLFWLYRRLARS